MSGTVARVLTAIVLIPLVVGLVLWGPTWLVAVVVAGIILLALHEFFAISAKMKMPGYPRFTMLCAVVLALNVGHDSGIWNWVADKVTILWLLASIAGANEGILLWFIVGIAALALKSRRAISSALPDCAMSAAGILFIAWPLSKLVLMHGMWPMLLLFTLVLIWAGDTAAFFVGRGLGKHLLAPVISPKKTWEGAVANLLGSLLAGFLFYKWQHERLTLFVCLSAAVLVSLAGQIGDLFESAWKRGAGVKDSGSLLPGHGGILDRIDALLLAAPVVWWYFSKVPLPK